MRKRITPTSKPSIILTVHNKDWLVERVIHSIAKYTHGSYELIVVFDGCTDASEQVAREALSNIGIAAKILYTPDVFETMANNTGLRAATGDHVIIIQDDMVINEDGWNKRLLRPITEFSDVFAVTARTSHNWVYNPRSIHDSMKENLDNCWCDILVHTDHADRKILPRGVFAIRDSVNRGPLLLRHDVMEKLDYFDEEFAPQDMDDHDLCFRAYKELGLLAGCYWLDIISEHAWGGTRPDGHTPAPWLFKAHHKNTKIVWKRHKELILGTKHNENRSLT
jgi:glycosyltransferase involved in cell wall biosynthesis